MKRALLIYKKLLTDGQMDDKNDLPLYTDFRVPEVREMLFQFEEELGFTLVELAHTVYLVPDTENELLSFSMKDIRESVATNARLVDAFLQCYIIMTILYLFYGGKNNNPKQIDFLQVKDIVQKLDERFEAATEATQEELESNYSINFRYIAEVWRAKAVMQDGKRTTRNELVLKACRLLKRQRLMIILDDEREIRTSKRLDDLMLNYYLSEKRVQEINRIFEDGEQNAEN